jgi:hypothetical protein
MARHERHEFAAGPLGPEVPVAGRGDAAHREGALTEPNENDEVESMADRVRAPVIPFVVDGALVLALIWTIATTATRMEAIDRRVTAVEASRALIQPEADRRLAVLETRLLSIDGNIMQLREEVRELAPLR